MRKDPLLVVNSKSFCFTCQGDRKKRKQCQDCNGTGFNKIDLSNMWSPSSAFLVCGGPSLNDIPKEKLNERGILSLAVNNSAGHVQSTAWVFGDPQTKFHHGCHLDPKNITFAPIGKLFKTIQIKDKNGLFKQTNIRLCDCPSVYGFSRQSYFDENTFLTDTFAHWGPNTNTQKVEFKVLDTMFLAIRLMYYMGCKKIFMLGVDFNLEVDQPYAFKQDKFVNEKRNDRYRKTNLLLKKLKPVLQDNDFNIYNCNPASRCDVFEYVNFQDAYKECKGGVPNEPFDLSQWYEKNISEEHIKKDNQIVTLENIKQYII